MRIVNRLVEGLLERRSGADRRTLSLHLTAAGERAASELLSRRTRSQRSLLEVLEPDEQAALEPLLERLVAGMADDRPRALRVCRLCDREACTSEQGCPLDHTTQADAQPTGFGPGAGVVTGTTRVGSTAAPAHTDLVAAYTEVAGRPGGTPLAGDLIGLTLAPGLHSSAAAVSNNGTVTLDGGGDPNAVFVFKIGGALTMRPARASR